MTCRCLLVFACASLCLAVPASAQQSVEVSGFVDTYYSHNFNSPATGQAVLRNFDVQDRAFSLNLVELAVEKKPAADSRGGFRFDLDYGPTQDIVNAAE